MHSQFTKNLLLLKDVIVDNVYHFADYCEVSTPELI